jgi:hypothetical protein
MTGAVISRGYLGPWEIRVNGNVPFGMVDVRKPYEIMEFHPDTYAVLEATGDALVDVTREVASGRVGNGPSNLPMLHPLWAVGTSVFEPDPLGRLERALSRPMATDVIELSVHRARAQRDHDQVAQQMATLAALMADLEAVVTS